MTVRELLRSAQAVLEKNGIPDAAWDASALLAHLLGRDRMGLYAAGEEVLPPEREAEFRALLDRRAAREPLQYICGEQYFMGLRFEVGPGVLIPRYDTEALCEAALECVTPGTQRALDLCCGSGALAVVLAVEKPSLEVWASDLSPRALAYAGRNAAAHHAPVRFFESDLFDSLPETRFGLIVSNPPYIPSGVLESLQPEVLREPPEALDGGDDGMDFYRRILEALPSRLCRGGALCLESGEEQTEPLKTMLRSRFEKVDVFQDCSGRPRGVRGRDYHD